MAEYIIEIPDECFPISDTEHDRYYPDERHDPMCITEIVRCRDCEYKAYDYSGTFCSKSIFIRAFEPDGYCAWGERKGDAE